MSSVSEGPRTESSAAHPWDGSMRVLVVDRVLLLGAWVQEEDAMQHFTQEPAGQLLPLDCHNRACGREGGSCGGGRGTGGRLGEGQSSLELAPHEMALRIHPNSSCAGRLVVGGAVCGRVPCARGCTRSELMKGVLAATFDNRQLARCTIVSAVRDHHHMTRTALVEFRPRETTGL